MNEEYNLERIADLELDDGLRTYLHRWNNIPLSKKREYTKSQEVQRRKLDLMPVGGYKKPNVT